MSALPKPLSIDEFLAWEELQELKYEFDGIHSRAMTGGTVEHNTIQANLVGLLHRALRGTPCRVFGSDMKVRTGTSIRYPDALVICSRAAPKSTLAPEPVVIFEVLSPSSARLDLGAKCAEYQTLPSLLRYIVLQQDVAAAEVFWRDEDGEWGHSFVGADGALVMPEIAAELAMAEVYEGVELATRGAG